MFDGNGTHLFYGLYGIHWNLGHHHVHEQLESPLQTAPTLHTAT